MMSLAARNAMPGSCAPESQPRRMRVKSNLFHHFKLICPVQSCSKKFSALLPTQIKSIFPPSRPDRGTFRDRHERWVRDAVDAAISTDE
jgi:hypothetical protein